MPRDEMNNKLSVFAMVLEIYARDEMNNKLSVFAMVFEIYAP